MSSALMSASLLWKRARILSQLHELDLRFARANATDLEQVASSGVVDAVIFFAVMEHILGRRDLTLSFRQGGYYSRATLSNY